MVAQQWKEREIISLHYRSITEPTTSSLKDDTMNLENVVYSTDVVLLTEMEVEVTQGKILRVGFLIQW